MVFDDVVAKGFSCAVCLLALVFMLVVVVVLMMLVSVLVVVLMSESVSCVLYVQSNFFAVICPGLSGFSSAVALL
jgi:hypothetical protein